MNCMKCGANLGENDMFCPVCGTPVQKKETNGEMNYNYEGNMSGQSTAQNYGQPNNYEYQNNMNYNNNNMNYSNNNMNYNNANNNINQASNKSGGNNAVKICVIVIIVVAVLVALGFIGYAVSKAINKKDKDKEIETPSISDSQEESTGSLTQVSNNQVSSYKVSFGGFELSIPDNLMYQIVGANEAINVSDDLSTWVAQLSIQKLPFQQAKQKKNQLSSYLAEYLASYEIKILNNKLETIDGVEFIIIEIEVAGTNEILAIAELNSMYCACLEVANENNDYDRDTLKNITPIIKTAKYNGDTKGIESKGKLKASEIGEALQKATEE